MDGFDIFSICATDEQKSLFKLLDPIKPKHIYVDLTNRLDICLEFQFKKLKTPKKKKENTVLDYRSDVLQAMKFTSFGVHKTHWKGYFEYPSLGESHYTEFYGMPLNEVLNQFEEKFYHWPRPKANFPREVMIPILKVFAKRSILFGTEETLNMRGKDKTWSDYATIYRTYNIPDTWAQHHYLIIPIGSPNSSIMIRV